MRASNQKERLEKLKQGEGTFVYLGGACDTEAVPGIPMLGKDGNQLRSVVFLTVEDGDGKKVQVVDPESNEKGEPVWRRAPQFKRIPIEVFKVRVPGVAAEHTELGDDPKKPNERKPSLTAKVGADGKTRPLFLEFPKGEEVFVGEPRVALKLRCLPFFKEVLEDEGQKKLGRPRKADGEAAKG